MSQGPRNHEHDCVLNRGTPAAFLTSRSCRSFSARCSFTELYFASRRFFAIEQPYQSHPENVQFFLHQIAHIAHKNHSDCQLDCAPANHHRPIPARILTQLVSPVLPERPQVAAAVGVVAAARSAPSDCSCAQTRQRVLNRESSASSPQDWLSISQPATVIA